MSRDTSEKVARVRCILVACHPSFGRVSAIALIEHEMSRRLIAVNSASGHACRSFNELLGKVVSVVIPSLSLTAGVTVSGEYTQ